MKIYFKTSIYNKMLKILRKIHFYLQIKYKNFKIQRHVFSEDVIKAGENLYKNFIYIRDIVSEINDKMSNKTLNINLIQEKLI